MNIVTFSLSREDRESRLQTSKMAMATVFKTWPGMLIFFISLSKVTTRHLRIVHLHPNRPCNCTKLYWPEVVSDFITRFYSYPLF